MKIDPVKMYKCPFCYAWDKRQTGKTYYCFDCARTYQPVCLRKNTKIKLKQKNYLISEINNHPFLPVKHNFAHESLRHPDLEMLRKKYNLAKVIKPYKDEFTQQLAVRDWVCAAFTAGNPGVPPIAENGPDPDTHIDIIITKARTKGNTYFCSYKAFSSVEISAVFGWNARLVNIDGYNGPYGKVAAGHMVYELWSNQFNKWYFNDSLFNFHIEKNNVPLSVYEIREEFFKNNGRDIKYKWGIERFDLPEEMRIHHGAWKCEWYVLYQHNNFFDFSPGDHIHSLIMAKDHHNRNKKWRRQPRSEGNVYTSKGMVQEEADPYYLNYPLNQTEIMMINEGNNLTIKLQHNMPNFDRLEVRFGGKGSWIKFKGLEQLFEVKWTPTLKKEIFEAKCVNTRNVSGPVSTVEIIKT